MQLSIRHRRHSRPQSTQENYLQLCSIKRNSSKKTADEDRPSEGERPPSRQSCLVMDAEEIQWLYMGLSTQSRDPLEKIIN